MIQDKIFFDEKDPTGLSYNTPFTFYGSYQGRLWSKAPGGEIKYYTQNSDLSAYATTGSNQFNGNQTVTGSLTVTGGVTGTATTASYVEYANVANRPALISGSAQIASFGYATTGSNGFNGSQSITGSLTVTGQVVAQTLNVQQVTSSVVFSSGSNIFGNSLANTQQFTGSMLVTGSLTVNGTNSLFNANNGTLSTDILTVRGGGGTGAFGFKIEANNGEDIFYTNNFTYDVIANPIGGKFGIGINNPSQLLHLYTNLATSSGVGTAMQITSDGSGGDNAWIGVNKGTGNGLEFSVENRDIIFNTGAATPFGGTERMRITSDGDLILGRSNYDPKFYMTSTGGNGINERFYIDGYAHGGGSGYGGGFRLYTRDTVNVFHQRLSVDSSGAAAFSSTISAGSHITGTCTTSFNGDGIRVVASATGGAGSQPGIGYWTAAGSKRFINQLDVSSDTWGLVNATGGNLIVATQVGNVGIGNSSPTAYGSYITLHIGNASSIGLIKLGTGTSVNGPEIFTSSGNNIIFNTNDSSTRLTILGSNGNVGIGTSSPQDRLDVNGSIRFRANTPNFTAVTDTAVLDYVPTSVFATDPTVRLAAVGTASVGAHIRFLTGTSTSLDTRMSILSNGTVQPGANGTQDLGTSSLRWATVYTSDLSLSNGIGDYTIVEGEHDLFLYNNKNNKVYKFLVEEVDPSTATPKKS